MEPDGSMSHEQWLSNNLYLEPNQSNSFLMTPNCLKYILISSSHPRQGFPRDLFEVGLHFESNHAFYHSICGTCPTLLQ